jgi:hypothetical protein
LDRRVLAAAALGLAALMAACGKDSPKPTATSATTTVPAPTTSLPPTKPSSTTVAPSTTAAARPTTTVAASSPEGFARTLFDAWKNGDRAAAAKVAQPAAVDAIFARTWRAADGWAFSECNGAAGSVICTWKQPGGQQLLMRVQNVTGGQPVTVLEVRFQP